MSLAELARFADPVRYEAEAIQLVECTHHAYTIGWADPLRTGPAFSSGDWQGTLLLELWIAMIGTANVVISGKAKEAGAARAIAHRMFHDMNMAFWLGQADD